MAKIEQLHRDTGYRLLRTHEDVANQTLWCHMHSRNSVGSEPYRPCFSTLLLKELREFQLSAVETFRRQAEIRESSHVVNHVILASAADVFNLGGDLNLFCRLIRMQDRSGLLKYARECVDVAYGFYAGFDDAHTVALVQGDALGGGFEAALCCRTIVAESGVGMGFPEVLFDLFPGMGAYSFLRKRISAAQAEKMMLDGNIYSSDELYKLGIVDVLVAPGEGFMAVQNLIRRNQRIGHARLAMNRVQDQVHPVTAEELTMVTDIWVDTAMRLGEKSLRTMERLVRAQLRRPDAQAQLAASNAVG